MKVKILEESGYNESLLGISLSYNQSIDKMPAVAKGLCKRGGGHNKFLESIVVWIDITAPRYWWLQFDTYRIGVTKQSGSTMHTIMRQNLTQQDFETEIYAGTLSRLNYLIDMSRFETLKNELPEGYLQRRIVCTNYKVLRHMINQREAHKLAEWQYFIKQVVDNTEHREFLEQ